MNVTSVLIVDDDVALLEELSRYLSSRTFLVATARDAAEAVAVIAVTDVDVVVADEHMPGLSGTDLLGLLQYRYPGLPCVLMTGRPRAEMAVRAIHGGVRRLLVKPFNPADLIRTVRAAALESPQPA